MKSFKGAQVSSAITRLTSLVAMSAALTAGALAQNKLTYFITFGTQNVDTDGAMQSEMINNNPSPESAWIFRHNDLMVRQDLTNTTPRGNRSGTFANRTKSMNYSLWVRNDFSTPITFNSGNVFIGISSSTSAGAAASRQNFRLQLNGNVGNSATSSRGHWGFGAGLDSNVTSSFAGGANPAGQATNAVRPWGFNIPISVAGFGSITLQPGETMRLTHFSIWNQSATSLSGGSQDMVVYDAGQGTANTTFLTNGSSVWRPSGLNNTGTPVNACRSIMADALPFPIQAQVGLGCFTGNPANVHLEFEFRRPGTLDTIFTVKTVPTGFNNLYVLDIPFANGSWNIGTKGRTFLRHTKNGIQNNVFGQVQNFFLGNGDADGDNETTNVDYSIWAAANGRTLGEEGFDANADFDWDGEVTNFDYSGWANCNGLMGDL